MVRAFQQAQRPIAPQDAEFVAAQDDEVVAGLSRIRQGLLTQGPWFEGNTPPEDKLFTTAVRLVKYLDAKFGVQASEVDRSLWKLPGRLFRDLSQRGALFEILYTILLHKSHYKQELDFSISSTTDVDLVQKLMRNLKDSKQWTPKRIVVYVSNEHQEAEFRSLCQTVVHFGCRIAQRAEDASIVLIPPRYLNPAASPKYKVVGRLQNGLALIHWTFHPESYDALVSWDSTSRPEEPPPSPPRFLSSAFLLDSARFNEWMVEADYEVDTATAGIDPRSLEAEESRFSMEEFEEHVKDRRKEKKKEKKEKKGDRDRDRGQRDRSQDRISIASGHSSDGPGRHQQDVSGDMNEDEAPLRPPPAKRQRRDSSKERGGCVYVEVECLPSVETPSRCRVLKEHIEEAVGEAGGRGPRERPGALSEDDESILARVNDWETAREKSPKRRLKDEKSDVSMIDVDGGGAASSSSAAAAGGPGNFLAAADVDVQQLARKQRGRAPRRAGEGDSEGKKSEGEDDEVREVPAPSALNKDPQGPVAGAPAAAAAAAAAGDGSGRPKTPPGGSMGPPQPSIAVPIATGHNTFKIPKNHINSVLLATQREGGKNLILQNIPPGTAPDVPPRPEDPDDREALEGAGVPHQARLSERIPAVLPPSCRWFRPNAVHPIEAEQMRAIMGASGSVGSSVHREREAAYMRLRNRVIEQYRRSPRKYLGLNDCRKIIDGDTAMTARIHAFLDHWGLINFQADPSTVPKRTKRLAGLRMAEVQAVSAENSRGLQTAAVSASPKNGSKSAKKDDMPTGPVRCAGCSKMCIYAYYILRQGIPNVSMKVLGSCAWCLKCFASGRYPQSLNQSCFNLVQLPVGASEDGWTDEETLRLIEGIERYAEDWETVAHHVSASMPEMSGRPTKSAAACVRRFVSLPIAEPFADFGKAPYRKSNDFSEIKKAAAADASSIHAIFDGPDNPLLAQLSFLASVVNPCVASAAAQAALQEAMRQARQVAKGEAPAVSSGPSADAGKKEQGAPPALSNGDVEMGTPGKENAGGSGLANGHSSAERPHPWAVSAAVEGDVEMGDAGGSSSSSSSSAQQPSGAAKGKGPISNIADIGAIPMRELDLQVMASVALSAAAVRARELADAEDLEIRRQLAILLEAQGEKVEAKLAQFRLLEETVRQEAEEVEGRVAALLEEKEALNQRIQVMTAEKEKLLQEREVERARIEAEREREKHKQQMQLQQQQLAAQQQQQQQAPPLQGSPRPPGAVAASPVPPAGGGGGVGGGGAPPA
uniref:SWIRM domain-containing protein n=1 Tax=Chromera velia CCMP2878 TaxID=1169474 RepID=A0A0G4HJH4_9ALVE|eukprot:Cvel_7089.t1-p1 / transcript=Cvel_7089.t1 / gene=Cvel_7089 / organism=Chromera_velia_CCMP2878 / gene_product=SWI/SNF and RSC complexes subunit ssr2, putative / transcript_product=SWI/SNF and RSC complexes subunit ssr2, putative / location=Cvel_scaffold363:16528-28741(-) / protein_length=1273 / sequence_SO=supercontig / SO=protein_coding / is_pseudo=false